MRSAKKLLDVATSLFLQKGIDETTVDDIVLSAGIAKGTFYHHFDSKATLLKAITEEVIAEYHRHVELRMQACESADRIERLKAWISATCEAYLLMTPRHHIAFADEGPRWTPRGQPAFDDFVIFLKQGGEEGCWEISDPEIAAIYIYKGIVGAIDDAVISGRGTQLIHQNLTELIFSTLGLKNSCTGSCE